MADSIGINVKGMDNALKMMKQTAPDEAKKQIKTSMRYSTNRAKARIKIQAPRSKVGHYAGMRWVPSTNSSQYHAPGYLSRKGILVRSKSIPRKGIFASNVVLATDAFYGWILNVGRYLTGGTYKRGRYIRPLRGTGWIDKSFDPRTVSREAVQEFGR